MISVLRLVQSLRFALRDMQGVKISDFELIETVNQAASMLYIRMSENYVRYGMKTANITPSTVDKNVDLPSDFIKIHQVIKGENVIVVPTSVGSLNVPDGTYRIIGNTFYGEASIIYSIEYYYVPARVKNLTDNLDVPETMSPYIEQISLALYGNNLEKANGIIDRCVSSLSDREVSHFENVGPVQTLGGRV